MTDYHVNTSTGDDVGGDGSSGDPWLTMDFSTRQLVPGDTLLVHGGANFAARAIITENVIMTTAGGWSAGTVSNPITIRNYPGEFVEFRNDSGVPLYLDGDLPYWRLIGTVSGTTGGISGSDYNTNSSYFIRVNCNDKTSNGFGLRIESSDNFVANYVCVDNAQYYCEVLVDDSDHPSFSYCLIGDNFIGPGDDASGIQLESQGTANVGGTIDHCVFKDCTDGVVLDLPAVSGTLWSTLSITDSTFTAWVTTPSRSENGIDLKAAVGAIIQRNTFSGFRSNDGSDGGTGAGGAASAIVIHSESTTGHDISENVFYNISGAAMQINAPGATIYSNRIYDLRYEVAVPSYLRAAFVFVGGGSGTYYVYNNTVYGRHGASNGSLFSIGNGNSVIAKNNIFYGTGVLDLEPTANMTGSDYNCWYNHAQRYAGANDVLADPLFTDGTSYDFTLQAGSPCIDVGTDVGISFNGAGPDLGALESDGSGGGGGGGTGGVIVARARVSLNTSTGSQSITTTDLGGQTPKLVYFVLTRATADGVNADNGAFSIGCASGSSNQWCVGIEAADAQPTTSTHQRHDNTRCLFLLQAGSTAREVAAEFTAFITNGVTINITTASSAYLLEAVFLAGADVSAYAASVSLGNTLDLATDVTAPGFRPDIVLTAMVHATNNTSSSEARFSFGVVRDASGSVTQRSIAYRNTDAQAAVATHSVVSDAYGICTLTSGGAIQWGGEFSGFDASGFTVTTRVAASSNSVLCYLALKLTNADTSVYTFSTPTATGSQATTTPAFEPQFVMVGLTHGATVNTVESDTDGEEFGLGAWTESGQFFAMMSDDDAALDSNTYSCDDNQALQLKDGSGAAVLAATLTSLDPTGYTLNYTAVNASARRGFALAIETTSGGGNSKRMHHYRQLRM